MALNKKDQARFDELAQQLRLARAFSWTPPVEPDVAPPTKWNELSTGFLFSAYSGFGGDSVDVACSSSTSHAYGRNDKTTTQNTRRLYSTKLLALQAMRHQVEKECAARLAKIDKQIEAELANA